MNLSLQQVKHVAELARLGLTEAEISKFQKQLSSILDYISKLNEVDTSKIEPTAQTTGLKNVTREDKPRKDQCLTQAEVLANAPDKENGYIKTKAVLG